MKATIKKTFLREGLGIAERATTKSSALPILDNILISTKDNSLEISGTNLEMGVRYRALAHSEEEGSVVVPVRPLVQFISLLSEENITLQTKKEGLVLKGEGYQTTMKTLDPEDFPIIPSLGKGEGGLDVNATLLCEGIAQVVGFAGQSQARPELSGVAFFSEGKTLRLAATDIFRLAEKTLAFREDPESFLPFILPQKTAKEVVGIFGERTGLMRILLSPSQIIFLYNAKEEASQPSIQVVSRLIEGEFPAYQNSIPPRFPTTMLVSKQELVTNLRAAGIFSGKTNEIRLFADPAKKRIEVRSKSPDTGEHFSSISATGEGEAVDVSFNGRFLLEGLGGIQSEDVEIGLSGSEGPAVFRPKAGSFLYMVAPLRS